MRTSIVYSKCPEWFYIKNCSNKFNFRVLSIFLLACCSICRGCEAVGHAAFDAFPEKSGEFPIGKCAADFPATNLPTLSGAKGLSHNVHYYCYKNIYEKPCASKNP